MTQPTFAFTGGSLRAAEINGHVRFIAMPANRILLALQPWRFLDAVAQGESLVLPGVYTDLDGDPVVRRLGPFASSDVEALATALRRAYALPRVLERVSCEALAASPRDYHSRHVEVEGDWDFGFELSEFAGAWLDAPHVQGSGRRRVLVRGIVLYDELGGYGHLGGSSASLVAYFVQTV